MDGLKGDVMEAWEEVGSTNAMVGALGTLVRVHQWVVTLLIRVEGVSWAVCRGHTNQSTIIIELEGVTLTETINNGDHSELVRFKVESLVDGIVGNLEGERVEPGIRNNLNVLQSAVIMAAG